MTTTEVIALYNLYSDNSTELSDAEELALLNRCIRKLAMDRPWEELKAEATGTISDSGGTYYITLPTDFGYLCENNTTSDISVSVSNNMSPKVIYVGDGKSEYQVVNFSDRRYYRNTSGYAYLDLANSRITFTAAPSGTSYEFDYIKMPAELTAGDSLVFPKAAYQPMIAYAMSCDEEIMEKFPKAQSYAAENQAKYNSYLRDLAYLNAQYQV